MNEIEALVESWTGDIDELRPFVYELALGPDLCERIFADKSEAFQAGLELANVYAANAGCDEPSDLRWDNSGD